MVKIMFVCHGNICRSPMAEFIMKDLVNKKGLSDGFLIMSSATSYEEIGNPIYPPAKATLMKHNIPFKEHYATKLQKSDYEKFDLFIVMDKRNLGNIERIFETDNEQKVRMLLEYCGENRDVSDPWYSGDFEKTFKDIQKGCNNLLNSLI